MGTFNRYAAKVLNNLQINNIKTCQRLCSSGGLQKEKVKHVVDCTDVLRPGRKPVLTRDEEEIIVACCDLKALHGVPSTCWMLASKVEQVKNAVQPQRHEIKKESMLRNAKRVLDCVVGLDPKKKAEKC